MIALHEHWTPLSDTVYQWWTWFEASGYITLPYPGSLSEQPDWLQDEFAMYANITECQELVCELENLSKRLAGMSSANG